MTHHGERRQDHRQEKPQRDEAEPRGMGEIGEPAPPKKRKSAVVDEFTTAPIRLRKNAAALITA